MAETLHLPEAQYIEQEIKEITENKKTYPPLFPLFHPVKKTYPKNAKAKGQAC
jgi:hypothetical protein